MGDPSVAGACMVANVFLSTMLIRVVLTRVLDNRRFRHAEAESPQAAMATTSVALEYPQGSWALPDTSDGGDTFAKEYDGVPSEEELGSWALPDDLWELPEESWDFSRHDSFNTPDNLIDSFSTPDNLTGSFFTPDDLE